MDETRRELLSQLIALARATDGSEHLITERTVDTVTAGLTSLQLRDGAVSTQDVLAEKRRIVPNCFVCAAPCGRTSPFDLSLLEQEPEIIRAAKEELVSLLCRLSARGVDRDFARQYFFLGLIAIGTQPIQEDALFSLLRVLREAEAG